MVTTKFNKQRLLHNLRHYLPGQMSLKDFVHHNPLHVEQGKPFFEAIFRMSAIFGTHVTFSIDEYRALYKQGRIKKEIIEYVITLEKGKNNIDDWFDKMLSKEYSVPYTERIGALRKGWKEGYKINMDDLVQPLLFRIINSYLDQGISSWPFPFEDQGLINAIRVLERNSFSSFFKNARTRNILFSKDLSIEKLLKLLVGKEDFYENYLYDQQFGHKGWSGIIAAIEKNPATIRYAKNINLEDFIILELLLEIDVLDYYLKKKWEPLAEKVDLPKIDYWGAHTETDFENVLELWQRAFEWDHYDMVLSGLQFAAKSTRIPDVKTPFFQGVFCVDDREGSLRRHIELLDKNHETWGAPGYFGAAFFFQPYGGKFYEKNAPVSADPKHIIRETSIHEHYKREILHNSESYQFSKGLILSLVLGVWAGIQLFLDLFRPKMHEDIADAFDYMSKYSDLEIECKDVNNKIDGLQVGYTIDEMTPIVEGILTGIGLTSNFAPVVYIVAHGSTSANNPHHGAHDCGACSGRPGGVNARVFAYMANQPRVRAELKKKGFDIPDSVQFVGAMHDTASDIIDYYDEEILSIENQEFHKKIVQMMEDALDNNAVERARRFASIDKKGTKKQIRQAIKNRSVSYFEPRPELGHGTNSLCYVGGREKIKGLFLDRRAFLQSYDYRVDPDGVILRDVLAPLPNVCGGINLEYYFSRMDLEKMGAGTKLPHNIMGLIGVSNSSDGDLRPGLPLQMIENHDPVRLLMMIEHRPAVIMNILENDASMMEWFKNEWLILTVLDPDTHALYYFHRTAFIPYSPIHEISAHVEDIMKEIDISQGMKTNHIFEATKENMPVHVYKK